MTQDSAAHEALTELTGLLLEASTRWAGEEWNLTTSEDRANAHRALAHILQGALLSYFETDPARPDFRQIVTPYRKFTGDNSDALYFDAPVSPDYEYVVRGHVDGAVYTSFTVELNAADGQVAKETGGVLNDEQFDVDAEGRFEIRLGGEKADRNWLELPLGATRITTRHYYEEETCAAADPTRSPQLSIEVVGGRPVGAPPAVSDASVAEGLRRVTTFVRSRTLDMPPMVDTETPPFVSKVPNQFPKPIVPGEFGLAAFDAHYSMAPYLCPEGHAVVLTGRWPETCRMANVNLWTRQMQTFDFVNRTVSLNRRQTRLEPDGRWRIVIAHEDPGVPNWLDTEGRPIGIVFFRYMLAEGDVETPAAEVVPLDRLRG